MSGGTAGRRPAHALIVAALLAGCAPLDRAEPGAGRPILGTAPTYGPSGISRMANGAALRALLWAPGLDAGYDPQGLAAADGALLVSAYQSDSLSRHSGPCRVFRIDPASGRETGHLDIPPPCRHAGGIAYAGGTVFVSDTRTLFAFPLASAFGPTAPAIRKYPLEEGFDGALATGDGTGLWIGTYNEDGPGRICRFEVAQLRQLGDGRRVGPALALRELPIPSYAQGAAVDPDGRRLWISRSDLSWGTLDALDLSDGRPLRRYPAPAALEGIDFDGEGTLWGVSEAGARHFHEDLYLRLAFPFNPLVVAIDTRALAPK